MLCAFQGFVFDSDTRELLRNGEVVHLTPKAFQLLELLIESRPSVLAKQVLVEKLWPNANVGEGSLPTLVSEIRTVFGEEVVIRTVHRVGYAFAGEASTLIRDETSAFLLLPVGASGEFRLREGENLIGREPGGLVCLASATVSRCHALVVVSGYEAMVRDLESKNGTFVRGDRVAGSTKIRDGDELRIGSVRFVLRLAGGNETVTSHE
jgi:DNA-binding winged helix-turn-helix (wHTH) protein